MNSTNKIDSKQNLNDLPIDIRKQLGFGHKNLNEAMDRKHDSLDKSMVSTLVSNFKINWLK